MKRLIYIYTLSDPRSGHARYVGKTTNLNKRLDGHIKEKRGTWKCNWIKSLSECGVKPLIEVLETIEDVGGNSWSDSEKFWIESLRQMGCELTNLDKGGYGGNARSYETKLKISKAHKGKVLTEDHKRKLSIAARNPTQETRVIRSKNRLGKKLSDETKRKLSKMRKGMVFSKECIAKRVAKTTGMKRTPEFCLRMSKLLTGKTIPEVVRMKMSASHKARFSVKQLESETISSSDRDNKTQ